MEHEATGAFRGARAIGLCGGNSAVAVALSAGECESRCRADNLRRRALAVMDLRLIGAFSATEPAFLLSRARRVAIAAFATLGVSGMTLFVAEASHLAVNPVFICKQALVAAGPRQRAGVRTRRAPHGRRVACGRGHARPRDASPVIYRSPFGSRSPHADAASRISERLWLPRIASTGDVRWLMRRVGRLR
jgi:hypothetical protein